MIGEQHALTPSPYHLLFGVRYITYHLLLGVKYIRLSYTVYALFTLAYNGCLMMKVIVGNSLSLWYYCTAPDRQVSLHCLMAVLELHLWLFMCLHKLLLLPLPLNLCAKKCCVPSEHQQTFSSPVALLTFCNLDCAPWIPPKLPSPKLLMIFSQPNQRLSTLPSYSPSYWQHNPK